MMQTLLVIDDESSIRFSLQRSLASDSLRVISAETARQGIHAVKNHSPDAVLLDIRLPDMSGLDAFNEIHAHSPRLPVIVMTAHGTTDTAIEAMKRGAFDYLLKPFDLHHLRSVVAKGLDLSQLARRPDVGEEAVSPDEADVMVGRTPAMQQVYKAVGRVAASDVNVLLLGESGTGKELAARAIYRHSHRSQRPFLAVNCAAIPETLLEAELFGYERGAFTGADRRRIGKFESAHGGTIFLDEIGDMSPATQAKVLRILQDQRFERVGGSETIQTDARIIAATNHNLDELVAAGRFRRDLYYRLKVYTIELPPLRERVEDLSLLVEQFIRRYAGEVGKQVRQVSPEALEVLRGHTWPGNVRELQAAIKSALVNSTSEMLTADCLPRSVFDGPLPGRPSADHQGHDPRLVNLVRSLLDSGETDLYRKVILAVDHILLNEVMRKVDDNQVEASRLLGISRTTLRAKLRSLGPGPP